MARENFALFYGQLRAVPRISLTNEGEEKQAIMSIKVLRRPTNGQGFDSKLYVDCPVVRTKNKEMIAQMRNLDVGDMVIVRGTVTTKEMYKKTICPHCETENKAAGNVVYITPVFIHKEEPRKDEVEGLALLKQNSEISNLVNVIGNVCREPHFYADANSRTYAQYQLAVNRRFRIREDPDDIRTDYPWIKTFGKQAMEDSKCLNVGSSVYISGALQTREITRKTLCEHCCQTYEWQESVAEIVPYYIGYLANCNVSAEDRETAEVEATGLGNLDMDGGDRNGEEVSS